MGERLLTPIQVAQKQAALSRKFAPDDVADDGGKGTLLWQSAEKYVRTYAGTFDFILDMQRALKRYGHLTTGQTKGVLNTMAAEGRRQQVTAEAGTQAASAAVDMAAMPA